MAALVPAMRRAVADIEIIRAAAPQFGRLSWAAMGVAVVTELIQANDFGYRLSEGPLGAKVQVVGVMIGLVVVHQITAKKTTAALRSAIQGVILVLSLLTFWLAVSI